MPDRDPKRELPIIERTSSAPRDAERPGEQERIGLATWIDEPAAESECPPATRKYYEF